MVVDSIVVFLVGSMMKSYSMIVLEDSIVAVVAGNIVVVVEGNIAVDRIDDFYRNPFYLFCLKFLFKIKI